MKKFFLSLVLFSCASSYSAFEPKRLKNIDTFVDDKDLEYKYFDLSPASGLPFVETDIFSNMYTLQKDNVPFAQTALHKLTLNLFHKLPSGEFSATKASGSAATYLTPELIGQLVGQLENGDSFFTGNEPTEIGQSLMSDFETTIQGKSKSSKGNLKREFKKILLLLDSTRAEVESNGIYALPIKMTQYMLLTLLVLKFEKKVDMGHYYKGLTSILNDLKYNNVSLDEDNLYTKNELKEGQSLLIQNNDNETSKAYNLIIASVMQRFDSTVIPKPVISRNYTFEGQKPFPDCVETSLHSIVNTLVFEPNTKTFDAKLLPKTPKKLIINFYETFPHAQSARDLTVGQAWADIVSGITDHDIEYVHGEGETAYELKPLSTNALHVLNYLLNTNAENWDDLGDQVTTKDREVSFKIDNKKGKGPKDIYITMTVKNNTLPKGVNKKAQAEINYDGTHGSFQMLGDAEFSTNSFETVEHFMKNAFRPNGDLRYIPLFVSLIDYESFEHNAGSMLLSLNTFDAIQLMLATTLNNKNVNFALLTRMFDIYLGHNAYFIDDNYFPGEDGLYISKPDKRIQYQKLIVDVIKVLDTKNQGYHAALLKIIKKYESDSSSLTDKEKAIFDFITTHYTVKLDEIFNPNRKADPDTIMQIIDGLVENSMDTAIQNEDQNTLTILARKLTHGHFKKFVEKHNLNPFILNESGTTILESIILESIIYDIERDDEYCDDDVTKKHMKENALYMYEKMKKLQPGYTQRQMEALINGEEIEWSDDSDSDSDSDDEDDDDGSFYFDDEDINPDTNDDSDAYYSADEKPTPGILTSNINIHKLMQGFSSLFPRVQMRKNTEEQQPGYNSDVD